MRTKILPFILLALLTFTAFSFGADPAKVQEVLDGKRDTALASWWGFSPEDSTEFLQAAINSGVKTLVIDRQASEWITRPLKCVSNQEIIFAEGTVVWAKKGEFKGTADSLFSLSRCENVTLRGEKQDGGKSAVLRMRKADYHTADYVQAEWRHGLNIKSSKNILIQDLTIEYSGGDGIYLGVAQKGVPCKNVTIRRVDCNENNRQGISVISADGLLIEDSILRNTNGTAPEAGIDFEPNFDTEMLRNCVMRNCVCEGNAGMGYHFYLGNLSENSAPFSFLFENCVSRKNKQSSLNFLTGVNFRNEGLKPASGTLTVRNFLAEDDGRNGLVFRAVMPKFCKVELENVRIKNPGRLAPQEPVVNLISTSYEEDCFGGISFQNVSVEKEAGRPLLQFRDIGFAGLGMGEISGAIHVKNDDSTTETLTFTKEWMRKNYPQKNTKRLPILKYDTAKIVPLNAVPEKAQGDSPMFQIPELRLRHILNLLFYVKKGEKPALTFEYFQVGRSAAEPNPLTWTSPSGKVMELKPAKLGVNQYQLPEAAETGIYVLQSEFFSHGFSIRESSVPFAVPMVGLRMISSTSTLYFYVPKGTKMFGVRTNGEDSEKVKVSILNPQGKVCFSMDRINSGEFFYPTEEEAAAGGIWQIRTERPSEGCFEDFKLTLQGVAPLAALKPEFLLIEKPQQSF